MSTVDDIGAILLRRQVINAAQLAEARCYQVRHQVSLAPALIKLGHDPMAIARALAEAHGLEFVDLREVRLPASVIELVPEALARAEIIFPLAMDEGRLLIVVADPTDTDLVHKLRFVLDRDIRLLVAVREQIVEAIDRHYPVVAGTDSVVAEFTNLAIDFSGEKPAPTLQDLLRRLRGDDGKTRIAKSEKGRGEISDVDSLFDEELTAPEPESEDVPSEPAEADRAIELCDSGEELDRIEDSRELAGRGITAGTPVAEAASPSPVAKPQASVASRQKRATGLVEYQSAPLVERHATVRYFYRMNPQRMFPLLVILSKKAIQEVVKKHVTQARSEQFQVALDSFVEIEPILPGCQVYPPRETLKVEDHEVDARFWVVPHVLGSVMHARVLVRQEGQVLAEVPLQIKVVRQSATLLVGALSFLLPLGLMLSQHFGLDFDTQARQGSALYAQGANWLMATFSPELLTALLLGLTAGVWLWLRPRQRDVFWDIQPHDPRKEIQPARDTQRFKPVNGQSMQAELFQQAERNLRWQRHAMALHYFEKGLAMGPASLDIRGDASLAASGAGRLDRALEILQQAEADLGPAALKGPTWYRMACLATHLNRTDEAMGYLQRAVATGYADETRLRTDPELAALRGRADFSWLTPAPCT